jgi:hypothetical protein
LRHAGVVEVDGHRALSLLRLRKIDEDGVEIAFELERGFPEKNLVDVHRGDEIELNPRVVLKHLEADGVLPADEFLVRIDPNVEMVVEQIVVRAVSAVFPTENIRASLCPRLPGFGKYKTAEDQQGCYRAHG